MHSKRFSLLAATLGLSLAVHAVAPFATARFEKRVVGSDKGTPITAARLDDYVCITIRDVSTDNGDHSLRLVIYDGAAREVHQSVRTITVTDGRWAHTLCHSYNKRRDSPGTWWYVAELDDEPLVSKELVVAPVQTPGAG
jgi:hypothetical protein